MCAKLPKIGLIFQADDKNPSTDILMIFCMRSLLCLFGVFAAGGWITTSNLTATVEPNKRSMVVICHGINMQLTENTISTHTVNVLCKCTHLPGVFLFSGRVAAGRGGGHRADKMGQV